MEMPGEKGVSVIGSLIELLVGALAEGCSGVAVRPLRGRYAAVARFRPGLALRLAEGRRGLYRAQPVTSTKRGIAKALYRARHSESPLPSEAQRKPSIKRGIAEAL